MSDKDNELIERLNQLRIQSDFCTYTEFDELVGVNKEIMDCADQLATWLREVLEELETVKAERDKHYQSLSFLRMGIDEANRMRSENDH